MKASTLSELPDAFYEVWSKSTEILFVGEVMTNKLAESLGVSPSWSIDMENGTYAVFADEFGYDKKILSVEENGKVVARYVVWSFGV